MGLGPNIIIRGFEEENYLAPMSALVAAGIMNTARLFIGRMRTVRDIVSVDSITFMVSAPGKKSACLLTRLQRFAVRVEETPFS